MNYDNKIKPDSLALGIIIGALYIITQNYENVTIWNRTLEKAQQSISHVDKKNLQLIVIPSMRTPPEIIKLAKEYFGLNNVVIDNVDKKAYLSGLSLAKFIVVMCD